MSDAPQPVDERPRVLALLKLHGWNATSFQILEPPFRYWFDGDEACVAYVDAGGYWVAAGAPLAAEARLAEVAAHFTAEAARNRRGACFFGTERRFAQATRLSHVAIGEQPVWDPTAWPERLQRSKSLREQLRRARAKGVQVREVSAAEVAAAGTEGRRRVELLLGQWLAQKSMAPMGFLVGVELFGFAGERRFFVAEHEGVWVALLAIVPVYARAGWLFEDLLRSAAAPNGVAELLIDAAMRAVAASGSRYVTLGLAPLAGEVPPALRLARNLGAVLYDFDGVRAFKAKLLPSRWDPIDLAYASRGSAPRALQAALSAFAGGGLLRFGLATALRGPPVIVRLLAALLIPWTAALALAGGPRWFPSAGVRLAWVLFDTGLALALWRLAKRWRDGLALALASVISLDALVTLVEAAVHNLPRITGPGDGVVVGMGVAAPIAASCVMWGALSTRLRN